MKTIGFPVANHYGGPYVYAEEGKYYIEIETERDLDTAEISEEFYRACVKEFGEKQEEPSNESDSFEVSAAAIEGTARMGKSGGEIDAFLQGWSGRYVGASPCDLPELMESRYVIHLPLDAAIRHGLAPETKKWGRFWETIHNLIAHPLLATNARWAHRFHDWTAERM